MPAKFVKSIGRTLDARPDRLDLRDREFTPSVVSLPDQWPDDASSGSCVPRTAKPDWSSIRARKARAPASAWPAS